MFCTNCGTQLNEGSRFCTNCGNPVLVEQGTSDSSAPAQKLPDVESSQQASSDAGSHVQTLPDSNETTQVLLDSDSTAPVQSSASNVTHVLPDSAFEPQTPEPLLYASEHTAVMVPLQPQAQRQYRATSPENERPKSRNKRHLIIGFSIAAVAVVCLVVLVVLGVFNPSTPIDEKNFPNGTIRAAVAAQLDQDGDGVLSKDEADSVTGFVLNNDKPQFYKNSEMISIGSGLNSDDDVQARQPMNSFTESMDWLGVLSNLKTLVLHGSGVTELPFSQMTNLVYADVRDNQNLVQLDLSQNKNLKTLFCDPSVSLVGLENADLYFEDLISAVTTDSKYVSNNPITIEYDTHARPIRAGDMVYEYDGEGRLTSAQKSGQRFPYERYSYNEKGLLSSTELYWDAHGPTATRNYSYAYDEAGNLSAMSGDLLYGITDGGLPAPGNQSGTFLYVDNVLQTYKSSYGEFSFVYDQLDRLLRYTDAKATSQIERGYIQTTYEYIYDSTGSLTSYMSKTTDGQTIAWTAAYDNAGSPIKLARPATSNSGGSSGESIDMEFVCNTDGYIEKIIWNKVFSYMLMPSGSTTTVSYIKHVGALADRASERYVPRWYLSINMNPLEIFGYAVGQDLYGATLGMDYVSFFEWGPNQTMARHLGVMPQMLANANELKLAQYDAEHWNDGLNL